MIFTKNTISTFISEFKNVDPSLFKNAINEMGMELEYIYRHPKNTSLIIGKIIAIEKIPSTHLNKCKVDVGNEILQIICGANNVQCNKFVIVALNGAKLFNGKVINSTIIKGNESNGMLCAYNELTNITTQSLTEIDKKGIILIDNAKVGDKNWEKYINFDDEMYDISIPANRNDLNSYFVFCKEIAGKLKIKFDWPFYKSFDLNYFIKNNSLTNNNNLFNCLNFIYFKINKDKWLKESDWHIKSLLMNNNIKPCNAILDELTIFSLFTNCPFHIYDANKIIGNLECCHPTRQQDFLALNGKKYILDKNDIVIKDDKSIVSLASIIGNEFSKLGNDTSNIIIEIGNFNSQNIRETALRNNINTLASKQSSKLQSVFLNLLLHSLINNLLGKPIKEVIQFSPNWISKPLWFNKNDLDKIMNNDFTNKEIENYLTQLSFEIKNNDIYIPKWRLDISNFADLAEEVIKITNVSSISQENIYDSLLPFADNSNYNNIEKIKDILCNNYFNEVKTYNLVSKNKLNIFNYFQITKNIQINTSNSNREYYRDNLIDALLNVYKYNSARKLKLIPIFEIQKIYSLDKTFTNLSALIADNSIVFDETTKIAPIINLISLKSFIFEICNNFNINSVDFINHNDVDFLYSNEQFDIFINKDKIGYIGKIKNTILKKYDLNNIAIYCFTINVDLLLNHSTKCTKKIKKIGQYQLLYKTINYEIDSNADMDINSVLDKIKKIQFIKKVTICDYFIKNNKKIYTIKYYLDDNINYNSDDLIKIQNSIAQIINM